MAKKILHASYTGATYEWNEETQTQDLVSGTGPDNATLAPLTLTGNVFYPGAGYNSVDSVNTYGAGNKYLMVLVYDDANETDIVASVQTITGVAYYISTLDYVGPDY